MAETETIVPQTTTDSSGENTAREYHRAEDGRFTSPPAESKELSAAPKPTETTAAPSVKAADAPVVPDPEKRQRQEYDRLKALQQSKETRTSESPSPSLNTPSTPSATAASGTLPDPAKPTPQQTSPSPAGASDNKLPDEYKSVLTLDQYTMLKRVGWLLPVEETKAMGVEALADTLRAARAYRADLDREFQEKKNTKTATESSYIPTGGQAPQDSGQVPQQQGQAAGRVRLPDEVESQLRSVATEYGDDSPVYQAMRHNEEVRQLQLQQLFSQRQSESLAMQEAIFHAAEDSVFGGLESRFPRLKTADEREEVRKLARAHANAMSRIGRTDVGPQAAIQFVAQGRYYPEIQEQERKRLADNRDRSLSGSVERGAPVAKPVQSMSPEDRDKYIFEQLKSGKKRAEVMAETR